jgi:hypothetical protein
MLLLLHITEHINVFIKAIMLRKIGIIEVSLYFVYVAYKFISMTD